ncbi:MAG TPA: calcium-binding protein [Clostridia bacterium]|nr:calcium-binding protein [Clostridia bacterium]
MKRTIVLTLVLTVAVSLCAAFFVPATIAYAEGEQDIVLPVDAFYYNGHTYALYHIPNIGGDNTWSFCEQLGRLAGVNAHLAYVDNAAIEAKFRDRVWNEGKSKDWCGQIGAWENNGMWSWGPGGVPFGQQIQVDFNPERSGPETYQFISNGYSNWCQGNEQRHWSFSGSEPDTFPPSSQRWVCRGIDNSGTDEGWHNVNDFVIQDFICEFDGYVTFIYADANYHTDYYTQDALQIHPYPQEFYADANGYKVVKPIANKQLADYTLPKQKMGEYPVHPEGKYNFHGWAYEAKDGEAELYGFNAPKDNRMKIWDYHSNEPIVDQLQATEQTNPIVALFAVWEDAGSFEETYNDKSSPTYLALSQFVYLLSNDLNEKYEGMSVGEMLNEYNGEGTADDSKGLLKPLAHLNGKENVGLLDFLYAEIGGWQIKFWDSDIKYSRGGYVEAQISTSDKGGWSFFAVALKNPNNYVAAVYEGTAFKGDALGMDSVGTDIDFALNEKLNGQFTRALRFFNDVRNDDPSANIFTVGHSLGGGLAVHAAMTFGVNAHTYNGVEGWTLPLTAAHNYLAVEFRGMDILSNVDSWVHWGDFAVGRHSIDDRAYHKIKFPILDTAPRKDHTVDRAVTYETGEYFVGERIKGMPNTVYYPALKSWTYNADASYTIYLGTSGKDNHTALRDKEIVFGGDGDDTLTSESLGTTIFVPGRGNNKLVGGTGKDTYVIAENPNGGNFITDYENILSHEKNRIEIVNLDITNVEKNVQMLDGDGNVSKGVIITLSDRQKITLSNKTLSYCEVWLVSETANTIWDQPANYRLIYPINGGWDENSFMKGMPASSAVIVNGKAVDFDAYTIQGANYFNLRDVAYILNGTSKQFDCSYDGTTNSIRLVSGKPYIAIGGEMRAKGTHPVIPAATTSNLYLDATPVAMNAYNINGSNYFKLRDIARAFDFYIEWDADNKQIVMDTSRGYVEE